MRPCGIVCARASVRRCPRGELDFRAVAVPDLEQTIILGAHGSRCLHVLIVKILTVV